jgi:F-type H+-transporting ATPase subunit delta
MTCVETEGTFALFTLHSAFCIFDFSPMAESKDITAQDARTAAQIEADVGVEHIGDVYARGLLAAAETAGQTAAVVAEFDTLIGEVLNRFPRLETVWASALVSPDDKSGIIDRVLGGQMAPLLVNFLKVVARHGRLDCLRAMHAQTHVLYEKLQNRIRVRLTTATPLSAALVERIAESLRSKLGGEPLLDQVTDPELIGGAVLRIGDTVYDGSIANQLENLRQQVIDRSAHEIQSRRDRFRYPAGN